jgi:hypothetical protein
MGRACDIGSGTGVGRRRLWEYESVRVLEIIVHITTILGLAVIIFQIWSTNLGNRRVSNFNFINTETAAKLELNARHAIEGAGIEFQHTTSWVGFLRGSMIAPPFIRAALVVPRHI